MTIVIVPIIFSSFISPCAVCASARPLLPHLWRGDYGGRAGGDPAEGDRRRVRPRRTPGQPWRVLVILQSGVCLFQSFRTQFVFAVTMPTVTAPTVAASNVLDTPTVVGTHVWTHELLWLH